MRLCQCHCYCLRVVIVADIAADIVADIVAVVVVVVNGLWEEGRAGRERRENEEGWSRNRIDGECMSAKGCASSYKRRTKNWQLPGVEVGICAGFHNHGDCLRLSG